MAKHWKAAIKPTINNGEMVNMKIEHLYIFQFIIILFSTYPFLEKVMHICINLCSQLLFELFFIAHWLHSKPEKNHTLT